MFFRIKTNKLQFSLQTPHAWKQVHLTTFLSGRASRCTLRKASFTLETALALPGFPLCSDRTVIFIFFLRPAGEGLPETDRESRTAGSNGGSVYRTESLYYFI